MSIYKVRNKEFLFPFHFFLLDNLISIQNIDQLCLIIQ